MLRRLFSTRLWDKIVIPESELSIQYTRSPGPGGQNVNKLNTKVDLRFHVATASWIPAPVRDRLVEVFPTRMNKEGELVITAHGQRTQKANRKDALDKLHDMLEVASNPPEERIQTEVPEWSKEKRVADKKSRSEIKGARRKGGSED
jgi:protein subunit release factor B